jgi:type I restriction enzyme M protein
MPDHNYFANLIWQIADLLRGPYRPPQYERVMLPMTVLRRFDCVLAPTKARVLAEHERRQGGRLNDDALDRILNNAAGQHFHNHSPLDFEKLKGDPDHIAEHLVSYIQGFSGNVRTIFDFFEFETEIDKMREANILYLVVSKFCDVDLHPSTVPNDQMGLIFENLIRRFNELANETAGDHFTPREVIRLMVNILFIDDDKLLATPGTVRKLLDPACGTGGMLAESQNYLREHHSAARLYVYGQDYNKRAFATAASDMLMKQVDHNGGGDNVRFGDSFTDDQFAGETFDYLLANPPFGYTRVTVERPLRLRYRMTVEDKARFLDACPHLLDDVQAIDKALGREPQRDWNAVWAGIEELLRTRKSRWKAREQKLFRSIFTQKDPEAEPARLPPSSGSIGARITRPSPTGRGPG